MNNSESVDKVIDEGIEISKNASAFNNRIASYSFTNQSHLDFDSFFKSGLVVFKKTTNEMRMIAPNMKVFAVLVARFWRVHANIVEKTPEANGNVPSNIDVAVDDVENDDDDNDTVRTLSQYFRQY